MCRQIVCTADVIDTRTLSQKVKLLVLLRRCVERPLVLACSSAEGTGKAVRTSMGGLYEFWKNMSALTVGWPDLGPIPATIRDRRRKVGARKALAVVVFDGEFRYRTTGKGCFDPLSSERFRAHEFECRRHRGLTGWRHLGDSHRRESSHPIERRNPDAHIRRHYF